MDATQIFMFNLKIKDVMGPPVSSEERLKEDEGHMMHAGHSHAKFLDAGTWQDLRMMVCRLRDHRTRSPRYDNNLNKWYVRSGGTQAVVRSGRKPPVQFCPKRAQ